MAVSRALGAPRMMLIAFTGTSSPAICMSCQSESFKLRQLTSILATKERVIKSSKLYCVWMVFSVVSTIILYEPRPRAKGIQGRADPKQNERHRTASISTPRFNSSLSPQSLDNDFAKVANATILSIPLLPPHSLPSRHSSDQSSNLRVIALQCHSNLDLYDQSLPQRKPSGYSHLSR
jgi:hypothetical protein